MKKIKIELIYALLLFISCGSTKNLTKNKAVEIAEKYITEQGYCEQKLDLKKMKISFDILDEYNNPEVIVKLRHNLLKPKAVYSKKNKNGWIIGFEYKNEELNKVQNNMKFGKGILISNNGKKIQMFHENIGFN